MKRLIAGLVACAMLIATPAAFAGDRGWHGGGHGYNGYRYYRGGHHHNNNDDEWAWALGGLVLGGIVGHSIGQARPQSAVIQPSPVYSEPYPPVTGRRLLRDLEGRCYDISTDTAGNELRTELPPSACNW